MPNTKVVYTSLTAGYDELRQPEAVRSDFDYICFSNDFQEGFFGIWQIKKIPYENSNGTRLTRFAKLNPHLVIPEYTYSLWVDANIRITHDLYHRVDALIATNEICAMIKHPERDCVYQEAKKLVTFSMGEPNLIYRQVRFLRKHNFPEKSGLYVCSIMLRCHNEPQVIKFSSVWWNLYEKFSSRDQMSVSYAVAQADITPCTLMPSDAISALSVKHPQKQKTGILLRARQYLRRQIYYLRLRCFYFLSQIPWTPSLSHVTPDSTLQQWREFHLPILRAKSYEKTKYRDVTLIVYSFPNQGVEKNAFERIECAILQTWTCLGAMHTVIVVNKKFDEVEAFAETWEWVEIQVEPSIIPGNTWGMSYDCITQLHNRFSTDYCLIIQDDGFPINGNIDDFLGKWDYIGAPAVRDRRRRLTDLLGLTTLNGGFSLRSRKICRSASMSWKLFWRFLIRPGNRFLSEDVFYTCVARLSPTYRFRHKIAPSRIAFSFSFDALSGSIAFHDNIKPFGFHGKSTAIHFLHPETEASQKACQNNTKL